MARKKNGKIRRNSRRADAAKRKLDAANRRLKDAGGKVETVAVQTAKLEGLKAQASSASTETVQSQTPRGLMTQQIRRQPDPRDVQVTSELIDTLKAQGEAIKIIMAWMEENGPDIAQGAALAEVEMDPAAQAEEDEEDQEFEAARVAQWGLMLNIAIGVLNIGDKPQIRIALTASEAIAGYATQQLGVGLISQADFQWWMMVAAALKALGYYDAKQGLMSILGPDVGASYGLTAATTTTTETAALVTATDSAVYV